MRQDGGGQFGSHPALFAGTHGEEPISGRPQGDVDLLQLRLAPAQLDGQLHRPQRQPRGSGQGIEQPAVQR
jgi:hypothetical protein